MKTKSLVIIILAFVIATWFVTLNIKYGLDQRSIQICETYGAIRQKEYQGTKWQSQNFVQSCKDNIFYASPLSR